MKKIVLILGILLANNLFADIQEYIAKCLGGNVGACYSVANTLYKIPSSPGDRLYTIQQYKLKNMGVSCNNYMKVLKKGCTLNNGLCCALLGDEYHSILEHNNFNEWTSKYGANCSLKNGDEAFKFYKKACNLGESMGCQRYSEFEMDLAEIQARERDKTQKSDITIRRK